MARREIRNNMSFVVTQIEALQKVMNELTQHTDELDKLTDACYKHGVEVRVDHQLRPNSQLVETTGVTLRVFGTWDIKWQCCVGPSRAMLCNQIISQHNSLEDVFQYLRETVLTSV